jgi:hypothetical protein
MPARGWASNFKAVFDQLEPQLTSNSERSKAVSALGACPVEIASAREPRLANDIKPIRSKTALTDDKPYSAENLWLSAILVSAGGISRISLARYGR